MRQKIVSVPKVLGLSLIYFSFLSWGIRWLVAEKSPFPYYDFDRTWFSLVLTCIICVMALMGQKWFLRLWGTESQLHGDIRIIIVDWEIILMTLGFASAVCVASQFFSFNRLFWPLLVCNMAINAIVGKRIKLPIYRNGLTKIEVVSLDWRFVTYAVVLTAIIWRVSWFFRGY